MPINDLSVIDSFMQTFASYIDSGFGLLNGDVASLTGILIGIDVTLAGLFWALDSHGMIIARLIKKVLYIGAFAFIINNFQALATIIFNSFAGLGLNVTNNGLSAADLLKPGKVASTGFNAAWPLLHQAGTMIGFTTFFDNIITVLVLLFAWIVVILAFFILAVQLFITVLEFKLTTLAGFVLVPFALWGKSAFLAERVLGNVISSGIKVMVLAVIVGIGSGFFSAFTTALNGQDPSLAQAMSLVLASISLFGIGIFGPAIASGLVAGAPQLGAGAAIGTVGGLAAAGALAGGAAVGGARLLSSAGMGAVRAGTSLGAGASTAYRLSSAASGENGVAGVAAGIGGVARAGAGAISQRISSTVQSAADALAEDAQAGTQGAWAATGGNLPSAASAPTPASNTDGAPEWARTLRAEQRTRAHGQTAVQSIRDGDKPVGGANPELDEQENG